MHGCTLISARRAFSTCQRILSSAPGASLPPPLAGLRVVDLSRVLAGPFCTQGLGDLGADVIKIEHPDGGDDTRAWGPPFWHDMSTYFISCNRNKRSVALDLKCPEGRAAVLELVAHSDVVVENFLPGKLDALGLGFRDAIAVNPRIVYASISGFGATGTMRSRPGYDVAAAAEGGLLSITGPAEGPPCKVGVALTDITTGLYTQSAILAALLSVRAGGPGQRIDSSLLDCCVASLANVASGVLAAGWPARPWGTAHESIVPYQAFSAADGYIVVAAMNDRQFRALCGVVGRPALGDPAGPYATNAQRVSGRVALVAELEAAFSLKPRAHWLTALGAAGVTASPINSVREGLDHPQVRARGLVTSVPVAAPPREWEGASSPPPLELPLVGPPVQLSATPQTIRRPPPRLGEHTREVLSVILGWAPCRIDAALASGAAAQADPGGAPPPPPPP